MFQLQNVWKLVDAWTTSEQAKLSLRINGTGNSCEGRRWAKGVVMERRSHSVVFSHQFGGLLINNLLVTHAYPLQD